MEKYMIISPIGEGSFAKVYRGREKYTGRDVALKFISKLGKTEKDLYFLRREIDILRKMKHENIVDMINSFETNNEIVVVTERGLADLYQLLEDDVNLPEDTVQKIACQLVSALYYLHSHRVLHRDMKPQNILIFPGGKVKLCDFGFARNMTMETMVLTSIKGTPLYMCPELVDEKPYDHSADLWALGCILYEVYHGKPPFFTNNVFHLIKMIGKESVKWPKPISPDMRNFLEGLLTKDSTQRLTWPDLLHHPFVRTGVKVPHLTESIIGPLTQPPTEEQRILKQQQIKAKGVSRGPSKLLSKFMPDEHRKDTQKSPGNKDKNQKKSKIPIIQNTEIEPPPSSTLPPPVEPKTNQSTLVADSLTIQEDKFVSTRENLNTSILTNRTIDEQQIEQHAEQIESMSNEQLMNLLRQESFYKLFETIQTTILSKLLECTLNGASFYRNMMKILRFILQSDMDPHLIISFTNKIHVPDLSLKHLKAILDHPTIRKEPWFAHILYDILIVIRLWFELITAYTLQQLNEEQCKFYLTMSHEFLEQTSLILNLASSLDYTICCETLMILIILCESYEDVSPLLCQAWYDPIRLDRCQIWPAIAQLITTSFKSENSNIEIYNETLMYTVATMAALTYPSQCLPDALLEAKIKFSIKLLCQRYDIIQKLLWVTMTHLSIDRVEVPVGLIAQLSYYQETARKTISQMLMNDVQLCQFYSHVLYGTNESEFILCETFFTFTNLIKTTDTVVSCINDILSGPKNDYDVLKRALSGSNLTKAKCCFLMGHMTKSSRPFCTILKTHSDILDQLRQCCFEEDSHVRKMAFFSLGNFISTNEILYEYVDELTPFLVQALNDTISKIRSHAVNTLGFLARYRLSQRLIELKVPEKLLDVACHDTHVTVQEFALRVLKQMLKYEQAKEILQECNATDKLSNLLSNLCTQIENNQYSELDGVVEECEELLNMLIEQCT
ncbi:unnamed protein product [Rotaria sordida]|uniref:non-specific serine/threonine protein kinase n=1 Tax=Rotaria sordida TaxID=392033 RepID=A0A814GB92_9BILA|nr:unnamed protein product [Rotaria sordida]